MLCVPDDLLREIRMALIESRQFTNRAGNVKNILKEIEFYLPEYGHEDKANSILKGEI